MIGIVDVDYRDDTANAACVLAKEWSDAAPSGECAERIGSVEAYVPGQFFRRELPCILAVLKKSGAEISTVVIDGYVWLDGLGKPGLGAHVFEALGKNTPVIGVAKTRFAGAAAAEVLRGTSSQPLFVTAAGMELSSAAEHVRLMQGAYRLPTLIKRVDQLCRAW